MASPDIDAVYIASPNAIHFEQAQLAIEAGKHVLVEKPAVLTAVEFDQLTAAAQQRGVVVLEAMRNAYDPALGGGALFDLGVYCVSAMVQLFGAPDGVVAASVPIPDGADGCGAALARYPEFVVDLSYSKITASPRGGEVQGELETLVFDGRRTTWCTKYDGSRN